MKRSPLVTTLLLIARLAHAQTSSTGTTSSHSGWNFSDTLGTTTDVMVADIVGGSAIDNGSVVGVRATVHVVRVLSGSFVPGADLMLEWQYHPAPFESPAVTGKVPALRALWFLRKMADGGFEPLQASGMMPPMGGFFLPVTESSPGARMFYAEDQALQTKIAREIGGTLEDLVTRHAPDLAPHPPAPPVGGVLAPWVQTRNQYESLTMALNALDPKAAANVFQYFSTLPDVNLKVLGLTGRLQGGDAGALFEIEKDLPRLASAWESMRILQGVMSLDLGKNLQAAHALARIALSENTIPGLEGPFAFRIGWTRNLQFLPYLITMLESPDSSTRDGALTSFCQLLAPQSGERSKAQGFWRPEMAAYCPDHSPLNDQGLEQKDIQFWKQWWDAHHEEIAKLTELPAVSAPPRYRVPPTTGSREVAEIPMEVRFQSLLGMSNSMSATHSHSEAGAIVEGTVPSPPDPVASRLSPSDREVYQQIVKTTNARLEDQDKRSQQMMNAARVAGTMPDPAASKALWADREAALKKGLEELRNRLSPEGWKSVESFMLGIGIRMGQAGAPK
jgi:hypothetical protein